MILQWKRARARESSHIPRNTGAMDTTLLVLTLCDPPLTSDFREALEVSRCQHCQRCAFLPLGTEYRSASYSPLARHVMCHLSLQHCAPASVTLGTAILPNPRFAELSTCVAPPFTQGFPRVFLPVFMASPMTRLILICPLLIDAYPPTRFFSAIAVSCCPLPIQDGGPCHACGL